VETVSPEGVVETVRLAPVVTKDMLSPLYAYNALQCTICTISGS
jgi:hypothetical protein